MADANIFANRKIIYYVANPLSPPNCRRGVKHSDNAKCYIMNGFRGSTGGRFGAELGKWTFIERRQRGVAQQQSTHGHSQRSVGYNWRPGRHIVGELFAVALRGVSSKHVKKN